MIICIIIIMISSGKMLSDQSDKPVNFESKSISNSDACIVNSSVSPKESTPASDSNCASNSTVQMYLNRLNALDKSMNEISRNQFDTVMKLERTYDLRLTALTQRISSMETQRLMRTLALLTRRLRVSSQNFGITDINRSYDNVLDAYNAKIHDLARYDICAIQDLNIPQSRWDEKQPGVTEIFKPILKMRGHYLVMRSFAISTSTKKKFNDSCYTAFGFYINPSFNFQFNPQTDVETVLTNDGVGVLLISGMLFDEYHTIFGCVRGTFDEEKEAFDNENNIDLVTRTIDRITEISPQFYVIIGDFKLSYSAFTKALTSIWRPKLPDILCESDILSQGSLLSSFDKYGYSQPDHVLTNMSIVDFRLFNSLFVDRMRVESVLYPIQASQIYSTYPSARASTRKLNVQLDEKNTLF